MDEHRCYRLAEGIIDDFIWIHDNIDVNILRDDNINGTIWLVVML